MKAYENHSVWIIMMWKLLHECVKHCFDCNNNTFNSCALLVIEPIEYEYWKQTEQIR